MGCVGVMSEEPGCAGTSTGQFVIYSCSCALLVLSFYFVFTNNYTLQAVWVAKGVLFYHNFYTIYLFSIFSINFPKIKSKFRCKANKSINIFTAYPTVVHVLFNFQISFILLYIRVIPDDWQTALLSVWLEFISHQKIWCKLKNMLKNESGMVASGSKGVCG